MAEKQRRFKPMYAAKNLVPEDVKLPAYLQPKLDGIRALIKDGEVLSKALIRIPNEYVQRQLGKPMYEGKDGELTIGPENAEDVITKTMNGVMTKDGEPPFTFTIFDDFNRTGPYDPNMPVVGNHVKRIVTHVVTTVEEIYQYLDYYTGLGYEGVMVRSMEGPYKWGEATLREGYLSKLKKFIDVDVEIVGFECLYHNQNEAETDALGRTKRSTKKSGMVPSELLGKFICLSKELGILEQTFEVGTGFTMDQRADFWRRRHSLLNEKARIKIQGIGSKGRPRFPTFLNLLSKIDKP